MKTGRGGNVVAHVSSPFKAAHLVKEIREGICELLRLLGHEIRAVLRGREAERGREKEERDGRNRRM